MRARLITRLCLLGITAFVILNLILLATLHYPEKLGSKLWTKVGKNVNRDYETEEDSTRFVHEHIITENDFLVAWDDYDAKAATSQHNPSRDDYSKEKGNSNEREHFKRNFVDRSCTMDSCFNFSRCQNGFKIYVYQKDESDADMLSSNSKEISPTYSKILDALRASKYITSNPKEACLFFPSVDTVDRDPRSANFQREAAEQLSGLSHWGEHGENHVLFNLYAGSWPDYAEDQFDLNVDRAILVKASYSQQHFRHNFDISLPLIHAEHDLWPKPTKSLSEFLNSVRKKYLLTFKGKRYLTGSGSFSRNALFHLHNGKDIILLTTCRHRTDWKKKQDARCPIDNDLYAKYDYRNLMHNSTLCLVPRGRRLGSYRFLEALEAGCVPVILSNDYVLPFHEIIDWNSAVVWADERSLFQLTDLVRNLGDAKIVAMRQQVKLLWDVYFSSVKSIVDSVLEIIRERLEIRKRSALVWNSPPLGGLMDSSSYSMDICETPFMSARARCSSSYDRGLVVSVLMTSGTETSCSVPTIIPFLREMTRSKRVKKVIVLWACSGEKPLTSRFTGIVKPKNLLIIRLSKKLAKSPGSRFLWNKEISSFIRPVSAILSVTTADFDLQQNAFTTEHINFAYNVWREFPENLIGFRSRGHYWDEVDSQWRYSSRMVDSYSMITGPMLMHKHYLYLYSHHLSGKARQLVDLFQCCEDFLMNFLVAHVTKRPPIRLLDQGLALPKRGKEKSIPRAKVQDKMICFNALARDFSYMPLRRSYARWDPLLYRDEVATWRKKYSALEQ